MSKPATSLWSDLFDVACSIIDQANKDIERVDWWTFGGGTALMLQIDHRESHDIDLFIDDPQLLPYFNPITQGYALTIAPSDYDTDGRVSLKLSFAGVGEIDIICCSPVLDNATTPTDIRGRIVALEHPAEILAKKVYYRGRSLQPRDIFDIASVERAYGTDYVLDALKEVSGSTRDVLKSVEGYDPAIVKSIISNLTIKEGFKDLAETAQRNTVGLLKAALGSA